MQRNENFETIKEKKLYFISRQDASKFFFSLFGLQRSITISPPPCHNLLHEN